MTLKNLIYEELESRYPKKEGLLNYGTLDKVRKEDGTERARLIEDEMVHGVVMHSPQGATVTTNHPAENITVNYHSDSIEVTVQPGRVLPEGFNHSKNPQEDDYVTPEPIKIFQHGDFRGYLDMIEDAFRAYSRNGEAELLLPNPLQRLLGEYSVDVSK